MREAVRLEVLTNELLDLARSGRVERREVAPAVLFEDAAAAAGEGRVVLRAAGAPPMWPLDPVRI